MNQSILNVFAILTRMVAIMALGSLGLAARCGVEVQKASDYADDQQTFGLLDQLSNPKPDADSLADLMSEPQSDPVRIAVIDNGVDYMHPALIGRVAFDSNLQGAGYDVMGDDSWAHANLINPALFAFSGQSNGDRIIEGDLDPLGLLTDLNKEFAKRLVEAISGDEILSQSAFSRIGEESMSAIGAWFLLNDSPSTFTQSSYDTKKEKGYLITKADLDPAVDIPVGRRTSWETLIWARETPWVQSSVSGVPRFKSRFDYPSDIWDFEHSDRFNEVLKDVYDSFDRDFGFSGRLDSFHEFQVAYAQGMSDDAARKDENMKLLQQAWFHHSTSYREKDLAVEFVRMLCLEGISRKTLQSIRSAQAEEKERLLKEIFSKAATFARELNEEIISNRHSYDVDQVRQAELNLAQLDKDAADLEKFIQKKGLQSFACDIARPGFSDEKKFGAFMAQYQNPYLSESSKDAHHGTHVAGIVASQSDNNVIVPVRVTTQSVLTSKEQKERIAAEAWADFVKWLDEPVIKEGSQQLFKEAFPSAQSLDEAKALFLDAAQPVMRDMVMSSTLEFIFMDDLKKAIAWVGGQKIKIANVSLGTSFSTAPANPDITDPRQRVPGILAFLKFEFFKHDLGRVIRQHAPNTLFVVAAGNNGQWADGRSRSALPCDLSSSYFANFENSSDGGRLANNSIDNILCVGSMNPSNEISSFSNLPITKVPFVLSYGEAVLSSIRAGNCDGSEQDYAVENSRVSRYFSIDDKRPEIVELMRKHGFVESDQTGVDNEIDIGVIEAASRVNSLLDLSFTNFREADKQRKCVQEERQLARLSGTSMAAPAVAGVLGRMVHQRVNSLGVDPSGIWEDKRFSPVELIKMLKDSAPEYGGESLIASVKKIIDVRNWPTVFSGHSLLAGTAPGATDMILVMGR